MCLFREEEIDASAKYAGAQRQCQLEEMGEQHCITGPDREGRGANVRE